ncbi:MAG: hypothetical protein ACIALR_14875 [Blastopirellula sp. JB062]
MPVTDVWETNNSPTGNDQAGKGSTRHRRYIVQGSDVDAEIVLAVDAFSPLTMPGYFGTLYKDKIAKEQLGPRFWLCTVDYITPEKKDEKEEPAAGEGVFSWDTTGATQHVTVSKETLGSSSYSMSEDAPDYHGAIGVDGDQVQGVDVVVPSLQFQLEYKLSKTTVTLAYIRTLRDLTGTTNNATFKGWDAGELLFMGSTGRESTSGDVSALFYFIASKNVEEVDLPAAFVTPLAKKGHEYLWFSFKPADEDGSIIRRPSFAYVERLYDPKDFAQLGIGAE